MNIQDGCLSQIALHGFFFLFNRAVNFSGFNKILQLYSIGEDLSLLGTKILALSSSERTITQLIRLLYLLASVCSFEYLDLLLLFKYVPLFPYLNSRLELPLEISVRFKSQQNSLAVALLPDDQLLCICNQFYMFL